MIMDELCCCPVCGRMIDFWQYHRNDIQSEYRGYCYDCENNEIKYSETCQKEKQEYLH